MTRAIRRPVIGIIATIGMAAVVWARAAAQERDAVSDVLSLFQQHDIVALGEGDHGNEQGHRFRLRLVREPRFLATVDTVVVEFGSAKYQTMVDRFVAGEAVPVAQLQPVWRDTTQASQVWDAAIYEEFITAIRDVNRASTTGRRLRVLLGDPPVDWSMVHGFPDLVQQMRTVGDRDTFPARVIEREVRQGGRKALVIYGDVHLQRMPPTIRPACNLAAPVPCFPGSIVDQLERSGAHVFNVHTLTGASPEVVQQLAVLPAARLIDLRREAIGIFPFRAFSSAIPAILGRDGQPQPEPPIRAVAARDVFDAVLWLGPPETITYAKVTADTCADPEYVRMRTARMALLAPPGAPPPAICGR